MTTPNWRSIRALYANFASHIAEAGRSEWGMDPYAWNAVASMTPIEDSMWGHIREHDLVMYPQFPIGRFVVDFGNPVAKVAIECDGQAFHKDAKKDAARDQALGSLGWRVYRFEGWRCHLQADANSTSVAVKRIGDLHEIRRIYRTEPNGPVNAESVAHLIYDTANRVSAARAGVFLRMAA